MPDNGFGPSHWFEPIADHLGAAYLRYSFTKGTTQECGGLCALTGLAAGMRALDVGCGPGRHARALATQGVLVHGVDISARFVELARDGAPDGATFERGDARSLSFDAEFDVAYALCQGAFGLLGGGDDDEAGVLDGMRRAVRPGGRVLVSAFSAYYSVKYQTDASFDASTGVAHEHTEIRDESGRSAATELWTTCFTPRELRLLARSVGLVVDGVYSGTPGDYGAHPPTTESAEFLLLATRPAG